MQSSAPSTVEASESPVFDMNFVNESRVVRSALRIPRMVTPRELTDSTKMLLALGATGRHMYEGTVPRAEIDRRRRRNKAARHARRVHRG